MAADRLFVIYGAGNDGIGLVGKITTPLAEAGGNIVDLRQDVLHGLFTIYLVVDFTAAGLDLEGCRRLTASIAENASLTLSADRFTPVPRSAEKTNLLCILVGEDRPGIAAKISATLSRYNINIEFSKMIAREGVFLMELLVDCSRAAIPLENLEREIVSVMAELKIKAVVQSQDVFNKKKRWLVFSFSKSFLGSETAAEIARQTGLEAAAVTKAYGGKERGRAPLAAAALLEGLGSEVLDKVAAAAAPTPDTQELVQTLKTFGYRVALVCPAADALVGRMARLLGIDSGCGLALEADPDTRRLSTETAAEALERCGEENFLRDLARREGLAPEEITVIRDSSGAGDVPPGIRLEWDLKTILELYNQRVLSRDNVLGLLGSFGLPSGGRA
ncbi:MAG: ACT domain-containing protein [Spirochaetales bacterium]|nr:ACT domain-containing protein [Spirochaetales bacterium]